MSGIRLSHPTARNCRFTIAQPELTYDAPIHCTAPEFGGCGQTHIFKTHHLNIDETGSTIINDVLYERVKAHLALNGFVVTNAVARPPLQTIGAGAQVAGRGQWGNIPIIAGKGLTNG